MKPRFYETAKHKRSYRCLVLHQLQRIADNTEEIKKLISKEKEPFNINEFAERFREGFVDLIESTLFDRSAIHDKHEVAPDLSQASSCEERDRI